MSYGIRIDDGGTNAGWRRIRPKDVAKCTECGGFISCVRADKGATLCVRCETGA